MRALQLDKTCSPLAGCAAHSMPNVHTENTLPGLGAVLKKTGSIWQNDKAAKGEYLTADICRSSFKFFSLFQRKAFDTNRCKREAPCDTCQPCQPANSFLLPPPRLIIYPPPSKDPGREKMGDDSRYLISVTEHGGSSASDRELEHNTKI